ncbi:GrpE-domain-containing protein [Xylariaceae sp. FL1019]|nr:GrpE-domain-containing protein [Xylariaceae sp. FL1019]
MIRQALINSSRALPASSRTIAARPAIRSHLSPAPSSPLRSRYAPSPRLRWYSDEAAKKEGETATETPKESEDAAVSELETIKQKLATKEREVIDWKDKYMRALAEFRNDFEQLQKRTEREKKAARDFAIQPFAKDLVDSVDNLDRALIMGSESLQPAEGAEVNSDLKNFYEGVKMTETNMMSTLKKHGLERFDPEGEKFNPNEHEATFMTAVPDKEDNTVFFVQQKGFKLNGRIVRAAKVGVVNNPAKS